MFKQVKLPMYVGVSETFGVYYHDCTPTHSYGRDSLHNGATKPPPLFHSEADSFPQDQVNPRRVGESYCNLQDSVDPVV